jgi:gas vesicle protein
MARFTDFLAGCVVGGAILATGLLIARRSGEDLHVSMLKDDSTAVVWALDRETGKMRFVSWEMVPAQASREMMAAGFKRIGELLAGDKLAGMVQAADRERLAQRKP